MGLDVTAYSSLEYVEPLDWDRYEDLYDLDKGITYLQVNPHFPDSSVGVVDGIYRLTEKSEKFGWHAGSYGSYNVFREKLADSVGYTPRECWDDPDKFRDKPFYELVNFSDCEGTIGTEACEALYQDFLENRQTFLSTLPEHDYWREYSIGVYDDWTEGFRIASNNGYVDLH